MTTDVLNRKIKKHPKKGKISDGYHTFDELYMHCHALFIVLLTQIAASDSDIEVWKSWKQRNGEEYKGWFIAGIGKEITYHMPEALWDIVAAPEIERGKWDGHTSMDVIKRLLGIARTLKEKHEDNSEPRTDRIG